MLTDKHVNVLGLDIPYRDRLTVSEREQLELLAVRAATESIADSRVKYEALRIFAQERLNKELPVWRTEVFSEVYAPYFDNYSEIDDAANELLTPFYEETDVKKSKKAAKALAASGNANALRAIIRAAEGALKPFYTALAQLEKAGETQKGE